MNRYAARAAGGGKNSPAPTNASIQSLECEHLHLGRHVVEPSLTTIEEDHDDVRQGTRAEAAVNGQMHTIPQPPPLALLVIKLTRHGQIAILDAAAAAAVGADEQLARGARETDATAVGALDGWARRTLRALTLETTAISRGQQPRGVENEHQFGRYVDDGSEERVEQTHGSQPHPEPVHRQRANEVGQDDASAPAGDAEDLDQSLEVVPEQDDGGALLSDVRP